MWTIVAISQLLLAAGTARPEDELSLLQVSSGFNYGNEGRMQNYGASSFQNDRMVSLSDISNEASSLDAEAARIERQLQQGAQEVAQEVAVERSGVQDVHGVETEGNTALEKKVEELRLQNAAQAGQVNMALEQQHLSNSAVDRAKQQLGTEISNAQKAWQSEQKARNSEQKAWQTVADAAEKDKMLEDKLKKQNDDIQNMVQQRAEFAQKLSLLEADAEKVKANDRKSFDISMLQAKQSEKKAWAVAKMEAEKALSEKKLKETLLAEAKAELGRMKNDVSGVQAKAAEQLKKEVEEVKHKVDEVKKEANEELHKASAQLHQEHAEVQSVVNWATKVQQEADAKLQQAKQAQQEVSSKVDWAAVARREASRASAAMEQIQQLTAAKGAGDSKKPAKFGF